MAVQRVIWSSTADTLTETLCLCVFYVFHQLLRSLPHLIGLGSVCFGLQNEIKTPLTTSSAYCSKVPIALQDSFVTKPRWYSYCCTCFHGCTPAANLHTHSSTRITAVVIVCKCILVQFALLYDSYAPQALVCAFYTAPSLSMSDNSVQSFSSIPSSCSPERKLVHLALAWSHSSRDTCRYNFQQLKFLTTRSQTSLIFFC